MRHSAWTSLAALVLAGLAAACRIPTARATASEPAPNQRPRGPAQVNPTSAHEALTGSTFRLHGTIEPVRSRMITVPRLTGTGIGPIIIVRLARAGSVVRAGEPLVEFDQAVQIKTANDRQAEYRSLEEQLTRKRADLAVARGKDETDLVAAEHAVRNAELDMLDKDLVAPIKAEENSLVLEEARARLTQLRRTFDLKRRSEDADVRILEISRDRARNAWKHAQVNVERMRILAPLDGLVVLKTVWKNGSFGEVQEGEEVRPGQAILDVVDPSEMSVRARVNQADVDFVRVGQPARVSLDSYPARVFRGRVAQLSPVGATSSMSSRMRTFLALIAIDGTDPHLLPDLAAAVDLDPAGALSQPTPALEPARGAAAGTASAHR